MNKWIDEKMETVLRPIIDKSTLRLALSDEIFKQDKVDLNELESYYLALKISDADKSVIDDYIACMQTTGQRYSDLSYIAGVTDAIRLLNSLNLLKDMTDND